MILNSSTTGKALDWKEDCSRCRGPENRVKEDRRPKTPFGVHAACLKPWPPLGWLVDQRSKTRERGNPGDQWAAKGGTSSAFRKPALLPPDPTPSHKPTEPEPPGANEPATHRESSEDRVSLAIEQAGLLKLLGPPPSVPLPFHLGLK